MSSTGKAIIFSAPSGAGKTTIVRHLLDQLQVLRFSVSATSRPQRGKEENGRDYHFISPQEFRALIEKDAFVEWEEVYTDHHYGTLKTEIEKIWNEGKHVIFDVDVVGGMNLKSYFGDQAFSIFVKAPSLDVLRKRLESRKTESPEKVALRMAKAEKEMNFAKEFDYILLNDDLDRACTEAVSRVEEFLA